MAAALRLTGSTSSRPQWLERFWQTCRARARPAAVIAHYLGYLARSAPILRLPDRRRDGDPAGRDARTAALFARLQAPIRSTIASAIRLHRTANAGECGLPVEGFVFAGFCQSLKLSAAVFDVWMEILRRLQGASSG